MRYYSLFSILSFSCCITDRKDINVGSDLYSNKVLYRIYNRIYEETKMCPSIIVSMPHRRWLEVNRDDSDGEATFGEEVMGKIYAWYHNNLTALVDNLEGRNGILFDLHGQGSNDWTIIGTNKFY